MDRNACNFSSLSFPLLSLSARRAWIEIGCAWVQEFPELVALRKESVDRNRACITTITICTASLSARRAWIEIVISAMTGQISVVALRKESVDRNLLFRLVAGSLIVALRKESVDRNKRRVVGQCVQFRRSPQGERG